MRQSDVLNGNTLSRKITKKSFYQKTKLLPDHRLNYSKKSSILNKNSNNNKKDSFIQGQHFPITTHLQTIKQESSINCHSNSIDLNERKSLKSSSRTNEMSPLIMEFQSNSSHSLKTNSKDEKDIYSERRTSLNTNSTINKENSNSFKINERCCQRISSSTHTSIEKETCILFGPDLCTDCIEFQRRKILLSQSLTNSSLHEQLIALAIKPLLPNSNQLTNNQLINMIDNQQIQLNNKISLQNILTDEQYFNHLSNSLNQYSNHSSPFYFQNLKDFSQKYQTNQYQRLLLSETSIPISSNPLFQNQTIDKFDISSKYSFMKRASTKKPHFNINQSTFVSPNQNNPFHLKYKSLKDFKPNFIQINYLKNNSNLSKRTLIGSHSSH